MNNYTPLYYVFAAHFYAFLWAGLGQPQTPSGWIACSAIAWLLLLAPAILRRMYR